MLMQFQNHLTSENIYLWVNIGIVPFWLLLTFLPNSKFTSFFINSIILPIILSSAYIYAIYQAILLGENMLGIFELYLSLENLYTVFATESFLLIFWLHFLALNLFLGSWISRDSIKYYMPRSITIISLILVYFVGPIGLIFYWIFRIFLAKRLSLHD